MSLPPQATLGRAQLDALLGFATSDEQWSCISAPLEPFVIVAGAGTGKTTVMAARVLWLVASGLVGPEQVLGLTFTNKAAAELASRVAGLMARWRLVNRLPADSETGEPTIATYHSFASRLVDEQGLRVGIEPGARLLSAASVAQLAYRLVCRSSGLAVTHLSPPTVAAHVVALDSSLAEQTLTTDEVRAHCRSVIDTVGALAKPTKELAEVGRTAQRRLELLDLVDQLRAARVAAGGVDFSDHMRLCVDLVTSSAELVTALRAEFPVVLLDEYQDTSIAQRVILSTLFAGSGVTAVGDPLQAIYGWRSASVANIAAFGRHFGGPEGLAPTRVLSVNRRSGEPVLAAANEIAASLRDAHPEVAPLRAPGPRRATVRAALLETVVDERAWIVDQVATLVAQGWSPESIGILGRTNKALAPLHAALVARGVPASISGVAALESSPYALAVLATLRVLADPADNGAAVALLAGPRWRIAPSDLAALAARAAVLAGAGPTEPPADTALLDRLVAQTRQPDRVERPSLLEAVADPGPGVSPAARGRLTELHAELRSLHPRVGDPLPELVARVVAVTGAGVEADVAGPPDGSGDVALHGLLALVDGFSDVDGRTGLGAFLTHLDAAEQLGAEEEIDLPVLPGCVQLMTMHKAKGLEFPVVVLPHMSVGEFPSVKGMDRWTTKAQVVPFELRDDRHVLPHVADLSSKGLRAFVAECRKHDRSGDDRLAYVGVTRAEDVLIASGHWWGPNQAKPRGPSPYLLDLRQHATPGPPAPVPDGPGGSGAAPGSDPDPWCEEPQPDDDGNPPTNPALETRDEVPWPAPDLEQHDPVSWSARALTALLAASPDRRPSTGPAPGGTAVSGAPPDGTAAPQVEPTRCCPPVPTSAAGWVHREVAAWDEAIAAVLARASESADPPRVALPAALSATTALELAHRPSDLAVRLARPMPVRRNRSAELGTAFHAWVESRLGVQPLIADELLPGAADDGIGSDAELAELKEAFELLPHAAVAPTGLEVPFAVGLSGRVIRGRIDAVFPALPGAPPEVLWDVVDWKTGTGPADPLQLAIYRIAWAEQAGVPVRRVRASFVFVRTGRVVTPLDLPDRVGLEDLLAGPTPEMDGPAS